MSADTPDAIDVGAIISPVPDFTWSGTDAVTYDDGSVAIWLEVELADGSTVGVECTGPDPATTGRVAAAMIGSMKMAEVVGECLPVVPDKAEPEEGTDDE